jgi:hypothetical protein
MRRQGALKAESPCGCKSSSMKVASSWAPLFWSNLAPLADALPLLGPEPQVVSKLVSAGAEGGWTRTGATHTIHGSGAGAKRRAAWP